MLKGIQVSQNYAVLLALPISNFRSMEHVNFMKGIALQIRLENMKPAGQGAKCLMQKKYGAGAFKIIDLLSRLDG